MRKTGDHIRYVTRRRSARTPGAKGMRRRAVLGLFLVAPGAAILASSASTTATTPAPTRVASTISIVALGAPASTPTTALPAAPAPPSPPPPSPAIDRSASQAAPTPRSPRPPEPSLLHRVERHLDSSGWGWREAGVSVRIGFHPRRCCHWGVYDFNDRTLWVAGGAFASDRRLLYVTLHELAHAWQWTSDHLDDIAHDMTAWGLSDRPALEAHADCLAAHWGAGVGHYWTCPPDALALVARRLAGDWT